MSEHHEQGWVKAVAHDRLAHLVRDAGRAYARALQQRLARFDVPFGHWMFLRVLWEMEGLTQKQLSERTGVTEPTTFAAMKSMVAKGWIERKQLDGNKKNSHVYLTRSGRGLRKKLVPLAEEVNRISVEGMSEKEVATTRKTLLVILKNLETDAGVCAKSVGTKK